MDNIVVETLVVPAKNKRMKDDKIIRQTFTCCGKTLEKFLWEGWDWIDGMIIDAELTEKFVYCPYCGKKINGE